ncbi:MAG: glycosyltransferase [Candidatus Sumerlaeia bacterium]|nr:glycosyltransferase [Candidatus Sumerlaeia bacterium]
MCKPSGRIYHIARVITWLPPGGIEKRLAALLPRLNQPPFRVSVVCLRERGALADELERAGVPVVVLPMRSRLSPGGIARLARWFRRGQVDLVHSHMYRSNVPATFAARTAGIRAVLCQVHNINTWETWRQRWMDRWLLRWRRAMIAVSEEVKRDVVANLRCPPDRVRVLYNGIDLSEYERAVRSPALLRRMGVPDGRLVVVVLARLVEQKGHLRLLHALESMRADLPPCHFLFVGEGGMRETIEREIRRRGLDDLVTLTGHRADVPAILASSDVSVLPSDREGFSNAIVESLAAGVPVVATDVGGNREAVISGECGYLVPPDDSNALAQAIKTVLDDGALRRRMSESARRRAQRFSLDRMLDETRQLYREVLGMDSQSIEQ